MGHGGVPHPSSPRGQSIQQIYGCMCERSKSVDVQLFRTKDRVDRVKLGGPQRKERGNCQCVREEGAL